MNLKNIKIAGEPYLYVCALKRMSVFSINNRQPTIVEIGDFIVLDRHFNTTVVSSDKWNAILDREYKRFNRGDVGVKNKK
ncbi:MAG: hypothetical protein ACK41T_03685 [Pseudobdellovibrio sp.]